MRNHQVRKALASVFAMSLSANSVGAQALPQNAPAAKPETAAAALPETPEAFGVVLREWVQKHNLKKATVTVRRGGKTVYQLGIGDDPEKPRLLASLSKAVTAACVATLIRDRKVDFDTPLKIALPAALKSLPADYDKRLDYITVAELITHRAGLNGNRGNGEASTGKTLRETLVAEGGSAAARKTQLKKALGLGAPRKRGDFLYSNDGYLLLGAIIEEQTGQPYEAACGVRALQPAGAAGAIAPAWGIMGPYGGWSMNGANYLAFLDGVSKSDTIIGGAALAWQRGGAGRLPEPNGSWYGLGLRTRTASDSYNHWHWGQWKSRYRDKSGQTHAENFNTFATRAGFADTSWFVSFEPSLPDEARGKLDPEMWKAFRAVKKW